MLVDGRLVTAAHGAAYPVVDPATGAIIAHAPDASVDDMDAAVDAARRAFDQTAWATDLELRRRCVRQLHAALAEHAAAMRGLLTAESGMPVALARGRQYDGVLPGLLEAADAVPGSVPRSATGVLAVVTPFTDPLRIAMERLLPALLHGDTVVLKPAADTPWVACELGRLAAEHTDLPNGVLNVVPTRDVDVAIGLTTDARVDAVAFTGSAVVAERVRHQAAGKRQAIDAGDAVTVEVSPGDDLVRIVGDAARAVASHAGQACGVPARIRVPRDRHDEAVELAVEAMAATVPGDPTDPRTVCGPVMSAVQRDRVRRYLTLAEREGGKVMVGGGTPPGRDRGFWIEPAVVTGLGADARAAREEILGPVLVVLAAEDER